MGSGRCATDPATRHPREGLGNRFRRLSVGFVGGEDGQGLAPTSQGTLSTVVMEQQARNISEQCPPGLKPEISTTVIQTCHQSQEVRSWLKGSEKVQASALLCPDPHTHAAVLTSPKHFSLAT